MDGVIYHGNRLIPRVKEFVEWLEKENKNFLFLTNSSVESVSCSCASAGGASRAASSCLVVSRVSVRVALRAG